MMLFQQQQADENMSNLTSASGDQASVSSGNKNEIGTNFPQQYFAPNEPSQTTQPPPKKKRNLPGNPDPDAEVIALSPKALLATNRFICEICNKGFQRDQNLQLHRRGHNLPWKLKQRANKEVIKKKVYVCPEVSCVHHDPSRALGDLTGIKKHFCRKHGEKKWKCDKCSKRYAVQSDWKAHSKTCGTREYRCDCGTLFSRRDSFITHRAFCDALAEESARAITTNNNPAVVLLPSNSINNSSTISISHHNNNILMSHLQQQQAQHFTTQLDHLNSFPLKKEHQNFSAALPPWLGPPQIDLTSSSPSIFSTTRSSSTTTNLDHDPHHQHQQDFTLSNPNPNLGGPVNLPPPPTTPTPPPPPPPQPSAHMSATALLQKAAQMGATMSGGKATVACRPHQAHVSSSSAPADHHHSSAVTATSCITSTTSLYLSSSTRDQDQTATHAQLASSSFLQDMMMSSLSSTNGRDNGGAGNEGLTRDFLGLRAFSHSDILSMAGLGNSINISREHHQNNHPQKPW